MAFASAAIALACPAFANAESLRPDPSAGPSPAELQPDAFPGATQPTSAPAAPARVAPVRGVEEAVPALRSPLTTKPAALTPPPMQAKIEPVSTQPRVATQPVVTAPIVPAVVTRHRVVHRKATTHRARVAGVHHASPRLRLPATVRGSVALPATLRLPAAASPAVARSRDLRPAALALLALVATSGCLLAVAARCRQEGLGA